MKVVQENQHEMVAGGVKRGGLLIRSDQLQKLDALMLMVEAGFAHDDSA